MQLCTLTPAVPVEMLHRILNGYAAQIAVIKLRITKLSDAIASEEAACYDVYITRLQYRNEIHYLRS